MKNIWLTLFILLPAAIFAQTPAGSERLIEVKGNAEMKIEPDKMELIIGIEEYWKEEFEKKNEFADYKTKIPLAEIEDALIKNLRKAGIEKEDSKVMNMGNFWRFRGKEFLYSKQLVVKVNDFSKINQLMQIADAKGIKYMNIGKLVHSNLEEFKKQIKIDALKDAREKARYLVESIGGELGEVITITELSDSYYRPMYSKTMMMKSAEMAPESFDEVQDITLEYQIRAVFRIK